MEVVAGGERPGGPFTRRNVQEWSRLDQLTGLLEHARVETDHWTASTSNSSHHFGKVVDSRSRNLADGGKEQRHQTKQLEVFQAHIPGGSLQVIRSSTSSSWQTHKVLSGGSGWSGSDRLALPSSENQDFDHLKLTLNPLDLSSQKTKASVGRSGSIGSRRPPSRPRSIIGIKPEEDSEQVDSSRLTELSSICHKVHEEAKSGQSRHSPFDLLSNSYNGNQNDKITNDTSQLLEKKCKIKSNIRNEVKKSTSESTSSNHTSLVRKKSCSSEDLHMLDETRNETDSTSSDWRRTSKVRRSLQFPSKQTSTQKESIIIPVSKSVAEIKRDIEARKQLVTNSFKANQWNNFAELEGVLGVVANGNHDGDLSKDSSNSSEVSAVSPTKTSTKKRQTFITVESLKEVRGRLRKLNSPVDEVLKTDDIDDGIDTEVKPPTPLVEEPDDSPKNSVKSYVYGMEVMLRKSKHPITGTGSLESRTSNKTLANGTSRSEEWYNRRKSYGFEQVSNQQNNCSSFEKNKIESSTDSGICRSSDTFASWQKLSEKPTNHISPIKTTHNIIIKPYLDSDTKNKSDIEGDAIVQKGRKTVVNLTSNAVDPTWSWSSKTDAGLSSPQDETREGIVKGKIADAIRSLREKSSLENQRLSEPITISIPIQQSTKSNSTDPANLLLKQTKTPSTTEKIDSFNDSSQSTQITPYSELLFGKDVGETSNDNLTFDSIPWRGNRTKALSSFFDSEFKRHSIAVDQAKYITNKKSFASYYLNGTNDTTNNDRDHMAHLSTSNYEKDNDISNTGSDHELNSHEKKNKKVEFCKTEVHFAAEPGRFNIVETDGKPPPSNMFRRRRKTTSDAPNRSGLPEIRFGDTQYEKNMLSMTENTTSEDEQLVKPFTQLSSPICLNSEEDNGLIVAPPNTVVHTRQVNKASIQQKEFNKHSADEPIKSEEDTSKPRSILKNNIPKPKPYILGESPEHLLNEDSSSWGVKLKTLRPSDENPKWQTDSSDIKETEFQKLLKSLRPAANKSSDSFEYPPQSEQFSTAADNGLEVRITSSSYLPDHRRASWSVADRVRHVEEAKGYSTKVNFGPQETVVVKADEGVSSFPSSEGIRSSWLIKEQNPSYDARSTDELESNFRAGSGRKLGHSQSFNVSQNQVVINTNKESLDRNVLKSTSLVLEVQNPQLNQTNEFDRKISVKDISTNLTRDNCDKNVHNVKEASFNKNKSSSVGEKANCWTQQYPLQSERIKKVHEVNTNTIPPIRKISSSTQTYFVNRSLVKKGQPSTTQIKINSSFSGNGYSKSVKESINGIPAVLNALDDLSRCIDEVIIESPQKMCKKEHSETTQVFKVKEDYKRETESSENVQNIKSIKSSLMNLDLLRKIVDSGELSEDSLKADEEVRAYMSTDNDDDTLSSERSGSWSRLRTLKEHARREEAKDTMSRLSPGSHLSIVPGAEISSEPPRVTSFALHYENTRPPATVIRPTSLYSTTADTKHPVAAYVSRNLLNTDSLGISSKVELSNNGDRTWSFSKTRELESVSNKLSDSDQSSALLEKSLNQKLTNKVQGRDTSSSSPSRYSINSHSPSKDTLFLERTAERSMLYNENSRHTSTSPTSGTSKVTSSVNVKLESVKNNPRKNERKSNSTKLLSNNISKNAVQSSSTSTTNHKLNEKTESVKKGELKKVSNETKTKERKLSTSSSGRDGWLNAPKEVQMRKKSEPSLKKQEVKKETKTNERIPKVNGVRPSHKRIESPIYQNREIYAERRDSNDNTETESTILEELTKAADQILLAVNGYTDDDSFRASSDDEYRKKREKSTAQPLCTISELPTKTTNTYKSTSRQSLGVIKSTRSTDLRKEYHSSSKTKPSKTSSNSSMEGGGHSLDAKPLLSSEDRSKRRAARLLQRASSRELLFQSAASSSEDMGSGSETGSLRTKRIYRRPRLQNGKSSGSKQDLTTSAGESRTKERVHRTATSEKSQRLKTQSEDRCSRHSKVVAGVSSGERRERRPQAVVTNHSTRIHKNAKETSQTEVRRRE